MYICIRIYIEKKTRIKCITYNKILGEPLHVGMDLTVASFDAISEVNMVGFIIVLIYLYIFF